MHKQIEQFVSAKIEKNILWTGLTTTNSQLYTNQTHSQHRKNSKADQIKPIGQETLQQPSKQQILDLEDLWNCFESKEESKPSNCKVHIMNICDQPETLTTQELEQVFGKTEQEAQSVNKEKKQEEPEDFQELWNEMDSITLEQPSPKLKQHLIQLQLPKEDPPPSQIQAVSAQKSQFYEIQDKEVDSSGKTCLTLGKNFHIFDLSSFLTSFFETSIYSYFGFQEVKDNFYVFSDLSTNETLMSCSLGKYEEIKDKNDRCKTIIFETDYCLKMRIGEKGETLATIWQKNIANGLLYNLKEYNQYERKHEESQALIEITDGYIGNNCYCNTSVYLSQKFHSNPKLKMKLSLKNGYLIAHMGVSGIKSAPYNCRLQNSKDNFVFLLGMIQKDCDRFIVRVGEGMSPLVAFAISVGRKRYIDSFRD